MADIVRIHCPVTGESVRVAPGGSGSGSAGTICVCGDVVTTTKGGAPSVGPAGVSVVVRVYDGHLLGSAIPPDPPPGCSGSVFSGAGWRAASVAVPASSGSGSGAPLTVVAWEVAATGSGPVTLSRDSQRVYGVLGGGVDCCAYGSGSGPITRREAAGSGEAVALAPAKWRLPAECLPDPFGGPPGGVWLLSLRAAGHWDSGAEAPDLPRVELSCEGPPQSLWRLRLRHGPLSREYTAPAAWFAVGPLTLTAADPGDFPATLTTTPA